MGSCTSCYSYNSDQLLPLSSSSLTSGLSKKIEHIKLKYTQHTDSGGPDGDGIISPELTTPELTTAELTTYSSSYQNNDNKKILKHSDDTVKTHWSDWSLTSSQEHNEFREHIDNTDATEDIDSIEEQHTKRTSRI